ncbi:MAG: bifunctional phosphopantothenoylcysteine decarboxylase/phosphopantothenate--cysteine ligase CoaBC [Bacteroidia bacterium]|nr:bifunctional phosphopantothenoylcysteine decarboxylase/phosphopantothenate--cysteine ligase CoaBC [Bacteroidia bacterium]MDW8236070.1 bifunctional phosphopantothenoylcysteine decarboxylase/phosphopantothenate--cysteine ligase CoaBC [Bacteroidia bacterium]
MAHILLGITGSIAAYKAPLLIRKLQKAGHEVTAILTRAAKKFVTPLTLETLTRRPPLGNLWGREATAEAPGLWTQHIALARQADLLLIAPATAHLIARLAQGMCDDLLSAIFLSIRKPVLIAPAMEGNMYRHPTVQQNLRRLRRLPHVRIIPPGKGFLASGEQDVGRLASLQRIYLAVERALHPPLLHGKRILITAGATREPWDRVRFLSNGSTGKMALALAEAAYILGAQEIHLLAAHTEVALPKNLFHITPVSHAQSLLAAYQRLYERYDWVLFAAAVSDYTFAQTLDYKVRKKPEGLTLSLVPAPDILAWAGAHKKPHQLLIGFALDNPGEEANAYEKLLRKGADWMAINFISPQTGMGTDTNIIVLRSRHGHRHEIPLATKNTVALKLLEFIAHAMGSV